MVSRRKEGKQWKHRRSKKIYVNTNFRRKKILTETSNIIIKKRRIQTIQIKLGSFVLASVHMLKNLNDIKQAVTTNNYVMNSIFCYTFAFILLFYVYTCC